MADATVYRFYVTPDANFEAHQALLLMRSLLMHQRIILQIVARQDGTRWQVIDLSARQKGLTNLRNSQTSIQHAPFTWRHKSPFFRGQFVCVLAAPPTNPLLYINEIRPASDPLNQLAEIVSYLQPHEEVRYSIIVDGERKPLLYQGLRAVETVVNMTSTQLYPRTYDQVLEHKQNQPWYQTFISIEIDSPNPHRVHSLREALSVYFGGAFHRDQPNHPHNRLHPSNDQGLFKVDHHRMDFMCSHLGLYARMHRDKGLSDWFADHWNYLEAAELAALWHLPHRNFQDCNVVWRKNRPSLPYKLVQNTHGLLLGHGNYQDRWTEAHIRHADRVNHCNIIGRTGVGKSTLIHHMIHQDIAEGKCVIVVDPHGGLVRDESLVRKILQSSIPAYREDDVVILDLNQESHPVPLNIFANQLSYVAIGRIVDAIEQLNDKTGVRTDKYLRAGIHALRHVPHATMKDLYRLYTDADFRAKILKQISDDETHHTLQVEYHDLSPGLQREYRYPILNRIRPFYANEYLFPILCHPNSIAFDQLINEGKIILISLGINNEIVPSKERNLIGSLIISMIQQIGMSPNRSSQDVYVYIDEVQHFVTGALDVMFSEARKYGIYLTVAHQLFGQLSRSAFLAIMGNVGTTIAFRSNVDDAQALAPYMRPHFDVADLVNLDRFQAAVKMQHRGQTQDAFLLKLQPPLPTPNDAHQREMYLRERSIAQYTPLTREQVLAILEERYPKRNADNDDWLDDDFVE